MILKDLLGQKQKMGISQHDVQCVLEKLRKLDKWKSKEEVPHQKWSQWMVGCQEPNVKKTKQGEKVTMCQITLELY